MGVDGFNGHRVYLVLGLLMDTGASMWQAQEKQVVGKVKAGGGAPTYIAPAILHLLFTSCVLFSCFFPSLLH